MPTFEERFHESAPLHCNECIVPGRFVTRKQREAANGKRKPNSTYIIFHAALYVSKKTIQFCTGKEKQQVVRVSSSALVGSREGQRFIQKTNQIDTTIYGRLVVSDQVPYHLRHDETQAPKGLQLGQISLQFGQLTHVQMRTCHGEKADDNSRVMRVMDLSKISLPDTDRVALGKLLQTSEALHLGLKAGGTQ